MSATVPAFALTPLQQNMNKDPEIQPGPVIFLSQHERKLPMRTKAVHYARSIGHSIAHLRRIPSLFGGVLYPSYREPTQPEKKMASIIIDYLYLFFIRGMLPRNYRLWRFDVKKRREFAAYLDEPDSPFLRRQLYSTLWNIEYTMLVNDKYLFHCYCMSQQIPTPRLCGFLRNGWVAGDTLTLYNYLEKNENTTFVIKPAKGDQGLGIHFLPGSEIMKMMADRKQYIEITGDILKNGEFVIEEGIHQHSQMAKLNPCSVNTVRLITFLTKQMSVVLFAGMLRMSASENCTDNFSTGGIVVGIDLQTGKLKETGFFHPKFGTTVKAHPQTNVRFKDFQIPFWKDVCLLAEKAQKAFFHLKSIGWDIAVTESGPIIIEGNIEWGTAGIQATNGGLLKTSLKKELAEYNIEI